eukprot:4924822-Pyramimonas_sp.AAC.1
MAAARELEADAGEHAILYLRAGRGGAPDARRVGHGLAAYRIPHPALPSPRHPYGGPRLLARPPPPPPRFLARPLLL